MKAQVMEAKIGAESPSKRSQLWKVHKSSSSLKGKKVKRVQHPENFSCDSNSACVEDEWTNGENTTEEEATGEDRVNMKAYLDKLQEMVPFAPKDRT